MSAIYRAAELYIVGNYGLLVVADWGG